MQVPYFCQRMEETKMSIIISMNKEMAAYPYNGPLVLNRKGMRTHTTKSWRLCQIKGASDKTILPAAPVLWILPGKFLLPFRALTQESLTPKVLFPLIPKLDTFLALSPAPTHPHSLSHSLSLLCFSISWPSSSPDERYLWESRESLGGHYSPTP